MLSQADFDDMDKHFSAIAPDDDLEKEFQSFATPAAQTARATPVSTGDDILNSAASGIVRSIPQTIDFGGAGVAKLYDWAAGGNTPFSEFLDMAPMNNATSAVLGNEYEPQTTAGSVAKLLGGFVGPGEVAGILKAERPLVDVVKGFANGTKAPRTADELQDAYLAGRENLKDIDIPADKVQTGLLDPLSDTLKYENPARYGNDTANTLDELKRFGRKGVNANYLESFRQDVGQLPDKFANPIREHVDGLLDGLDVPTDFRTAYATKRQGERLDTALTKAGDSVTKRRNAVNGFAATQRGLTDETLQELIDAGRPGPGEKLARKSATLMGAGPATLGAILTSNPLFLIPGVLGKVLEAGADARAGSKIDKALKTVKAGGPPPRKAEQFGGMLRRLLQ